MEPRHRRAGAFAELQRRIGLEPQRILATGGFLLPYSVDSRGRGRRCLGALLGPPAALAFAVGGKLGLALPVGLGLLISEDGAEDFGA